MKKFSKEILKWGEVTNNELIKHIKILKNTIKQLKEENAKLKSENRKLKRR